MAARYAVAYSVAALFGPRLDDAVAMISAAGAWLLVNEVLVATAVRLRLGDSWTSTVVRLLREDGLSRLGLLALAPPVVARTVESNDKVSFELGWPFQAVTGEPRLARRPLPTSRPVPTPRRWIHSPRYGAIDNDRLSRYVSHFVPICYHLCCRPQDNVRGRARFQRARGLPVQPRCESASPENSLNRLMVST